MGALVVPHGAEARDPALEPPAPATEEEAPVEAGMAGHSAVIMEATEEDSGEAAEEGMEVGENNEIGVYLHNIRHVLCQVAIMVEDTGPPEAATGTTEEADNRTEGIKDGLRDQNEKYDYDVYMIMIMLSDVLCTHSLIYFLSCIHLV